MDGSEVNKESTADSVDPSTDVVSTKGRKKQEKWQRIKAGKVAKRRQKKVESKAKLKEAMAATENDGDEADVQRHSKKFRKRMEKERLESVMKRFRESRRLKTGFSDCLHVCIDLQFESLMSDKELSHLAGQLSRVYGANRTSPEPALISVTSLANDSRTMNICKQKSDGFANYIWHSTPEPVTSAFTTEKRDDDVSGVNKSDDVSGVNKSNEVNGVKSDDVVNGVKSDDVDVINNDVNGAKSDDVNDQKSKSVIEAKDGDDVKNAKAVDDVSGPVHVQKVIYLTPDSPHVLQSLEAGTVYVIGGLVDDSIKKNSSHSFASANDISTARLPIDQFAEKVSSSQSSSFKKVLAINQVFDILMKFRDCRDWKEALKDVLPKRFGFEVK